jgi:hypothetical protein
MPPRRHRCTHCHMCSWNNGLHQPCSSPVSLPVSYWLYIRYHSAPTVLTILYTHRLQSSQRNRPRHDGQVTRHAERPSCDEQNPGHVFGSFATTDAAKQACAAAWRDRVWLAPILSDSTPPRDTTLRIMLRKRCHGGRQDMRLTTVWVTTTQRQPWLLC